MSDDILWHNEEPIRALGIKVPAWIDQAIDPCTLAAILKGGCASGAYMPAVSVPECSITMGAHGADVVEYVQEAYGTAANNEPGTWWSICEWWLTTAVELWASAISHDVVKALKVKAALEADADSASSEELEAADDVLRVLEEGDSRDDNPQGGWPS